MRAAIYVERRKTMASTVVRSATAFLVLGIIAMTAGMSLAASSGNEQARAKLGPLADKEGWDQLIGLVSMISAPATLLGFGVVLSWMIGREFSDDTIAGLFALPVTRRSIVAAKLVVFWAWASATAVALVTSTVLLGLVLGYGLPTNGDVVALARLLFVVVLTGLLALPAGWAATLGRGLLPGIAVTVAMITFGQVLVVAGTGAWFPVAAPALWAVTPDEVATVQLALVPVTALVMAALTVRSWQRLQLNR